MRTFAALDGLRCLSILAVVWLHAGDAAWLTNALPAARTGFLGVDLFFEISGFLIVTLLLRERDRAGSISLRQFYVRRTLRIFPLYYGVLLAYALLYFVIRRHGAGAATFRHDLPVLLTYRSNWVPVSGMLAITWSLSAEEQFYLVWPPIEAWTGRHATKVLVVLLAVGAAIALGLMDPWLARWFGWQPDEPVMLREVTFTPICLGVLLAHVLHDRRGYALVSRGLGARVAAPVCLLLLFALCNVLPDDVRGWGRLSVHLLMFFLLASCVVREDHGLRWLLTFRPIAIIGALSYGIYLLHHPALAVARVALARTGLEDTKLKLVIGLPLAIAAAALSHRFYERPFLRLKDRFGHVTPHR